MKRIWWRIIGSEFNCVELSGSVLWRVMPCDAIKSVNQILMLLATRRYDHMILGRKTLINQSIMLGDLTLVYWKVYLYSLFCHLYTLPSLPKFHPVHLSYGPTTHVEFLSQSRERRVPSRHHSCHQFVQNLHIIRNRIFVVIVIIVIAPIAFTLSSQPQTIDC